jgi:hypothetical protein
MSENPWRAPHLLDYIYAILVELDDLAQKAGAPRLAGLCRDAADEARTQLALRSAQPQSNQDGGEAA